MNENPQNLTENSIVKKIDQIFSIHKDNTIVSRDEIYPIVEEIGFENFIKSILNKGYLVHGSQFLLEELEPRQAVDTQGVPENEHNAVYATDVPAIAMFISMVSSKKINEQMASVNFGAGINNEGNPVFSASEPLDKFMDNGYLYVLNKNDFTPVTSSKNEEQFISNKSVKPVLVLPVEPKDFTYKIEVK